MNLDKIIFQEWNSNLAKIPGAGKNMDIKTSMNVKIKGPNWIESKSKQKERGWF